jgi:chromosomal replication initiation ATPase DnaA
MIDRANKGTAEAAANMRIVDEELAKRPLKVVRVSEVIDAVCSVTSVPYSDMASDSRRAEIVRARRLCVVCLYDICRRSFPEIARAMSKRSHSTVIAQYHANRDDDMIRDIDRVRLMVTKGAN